MTSPKFLGSCEVCGRLVRNYRSLATHLRHSSDPEHQDLKRRWHAWRSTYQATLRCRKCGELFEIRDKKEKDRKRCPRCERLRQTMGKRAYEALHFEKPPDPRQLMTDSNSKAQWDGLNSRSVVWSPGDGLYREVVSAWKNGEWAKSTMERLGISYKIYRAICVHRFGLEYEETVLRRRQETIGRNRENARTESGLETLFVEQIENLGFRVCGRNSWMTVRVAGEKVKREADIKVSVGDGRKVIVLCDGEVYHGPACLYEDPQIRIARDRNTALAFFDLGYSVLRYSETEVHDGTALEHFADVMGRLDSCQKIYRNWCPDEETAQ